MERDGPRTLGAMQQDLWRLVTAPGGVQEALAGGGEAKLAALVRADRGLGAADRGAHLAEHLSTRPFAEIFSRRCPYAAELARLEWAMAEAFYAADSPVLTREDLEAVSPEGWSGLRLEPVPSLRILACAWPVHRVRERFDREDAEAAWKDAPRLVADPTRLSVWRHGERVHYQSISELEFQALGAARTGESFGAICERVASAAGEADAAAVAAAFLASWVSGGLLAGRLRDGPSVRRKRLPSSTRRAAEMS